MGASSSRCWIQEEVFGPIESVQPAKAWNDIMLSNILLFRSHIAGGGKGSADRSSGVDGCIAQRALKPALSCRCTFVHGLSLFISADVGMLEILHPHPSDSHPYPSHHTSEDEEGRIISNNGQGRVILELGGRVRCFPHVPRPTPHAETAAHANDKYDPCDTENDPPPPTSL